MAEVMTDRQYDGILQMIEMIVDSCKDLEEAKQKIAELRKEKKEKEQNEQQGNFEKTLEMIFDLCYPKKRLSIMLT